MVDKNGYILLRMYPFEFYLIRVGQAVLFFSFFLFLISLFPVFLSLNFELCSKSFSFLLCFDLICRLCVRMAETFYLVPMASCEIGDLYREVTIIHTDGPKFSQTAPFCQIVYVHIKRKPIL